MAYMRRQRLIRRPRRIQTFPDIVMTLSSCAKCLIRAKIVLIWHLRSLVYLEVLAYHAKVGRECAIMWL